MVEEDGLILGTTMGGRTVTVAVPVTPLFEPVVVIVAVPSAMPVTSPSAFTVATLSSLELQANDVSFTSVDEGLS